VRRTFGEFYREYFAFYLLVAVVVVVAAAAVRLDYYMAIQRCATIHPIKRAGCGYMFVTPCRRINRRPVSRTKLTPSQR